jgi:hypothetical protein
MSTQSDANKQAVEAVARLYRYGISETDLTHVEVSRMTTYLLSLFFVEKSHRQVDLSAISTALDIHNVSMLKTLGNPLLTSLTVSHELESLTNEWWLIIDECRLVEWNEVSPLVFGSAFQGVLEMDSQEITKELSHGGGKRREFGAHYTSEENVLKLIGPLFLDELIQEAALAEVEPFLRKLSSLTFLDPALGCASFPIVIYKSLRRIEMDVLQKRGNAVGSDDYRVSLSQLYGIEINPEAALVAELALAVTALQMDAESHERFGSVSHDHSSAHITVANALRIDWESVLPAEHCHYVVGNPPFRGALKMTKDQKADMKAVGIEAPIKSWGALDLVAAWFIKTAVYINGAQVIQPHIELDGLFDLWESSVPVIDTNATITADFAPIATKAAFVATNSVAQGSHVPNLWTWMFEHDMEIGFAYPSFKWTNDAAGHASVTVVIIGFGAEGTFESKTIYSNDEAKSVDFINGGLTPLNVKAVEPVRGRVLSPGIPNAELGNLPRGKAFVVLPEDRADAIRRNPELERWIPSFIGADELTKNGEQYCLWLVDAPQRILDDPFVAGRVRSVKEQRLASTKKETRDAAETPAIFDEVRQPIQGYLAIPTSSSANRKYIPMKFLPKTTIASNALKTISGATPYHFAVLSSSMHMAWMRSTSARLGGGNDYSYSVASSYNTFPWVEAELSMLEEITVHGRDVLGVRNEYVDIPLGKLYTNMPEPLALSHDLLNAAVDRAYGYEGADTDEARFEFLYRLYERLLDR